MFCGPQPTARSSPRTGQEKETFPKLPAFSLFSLIFPSALSLQLSNIFDVEYVNCQLRHSGILEAIHIRKEGYPVRLPFQTFLARYRGVLAWDPPALDDLFSESSMSSAGFCHSHSPCPRYGLLGGSRPRSLEQREGCAAVLAHVLGNPSDLYQIGVTKVRPTENPIWIAQPTHPFPGWQSTERSSASAQRGRALHTFSSHLCLLSQVPRRHF